MFIKILATIGAMIGMVICAILLMFIIGWIIAVTDYLISKRSAKFQKTIKKIGSIISNIILILFGLFILVTWFLTIYQDLWKG